MKRFVEGNTPHSFTNYAVSDETGQDDQREKDKTESVQPCRFFKLLYPVVILTVCDGFVVKPRRTFSSICGAVVLLSGTILLISQCFS